MEGHNTGELLCVSDSDKTYAFEFAYVAEISIGMNISKIPSLPRHFAGVCNNRGEIIPVVRMGSVVEIKEQDDGSETILLVLKNKNYKFAILLDEEPFITAYSELGRVRSQMEAPEDCLWVEKSIWKSDLGLISLIDVERTIDKLILFK